MTWETIKQKMDGIADKRYASFSLSLTPTAYTLVGVRIPQLREIAKSLTLDQVEQLLENPCFDTFETVMLYGFLLARTTSVDDKLFKRIDEFLTVADNWAHIDCVLSSLKIIKKSKDLFLRRYEKLKSHKGIFHRRFLAVMLLNYYLDDQSFYQSMVVLSQIKGGEYYVDMAIGWALSVMMTKNFDVTVSAINQRMFSPNISVKAVQKGIESRRLSEKEKEKLRELRSLLKSKVDKST